MIKSLLNYSPWKIIGSVWSVLTTLCGWRISTWYDRVNLSADLQFNLVIKLAYRFYFKQKWKIIYIENDLIKHLGWSMRAEWYHDLASDFWKHLKETKLWGPNQKHTFPTYMRERERERVGVVVFIRCANAY